MTPLEQFQQCHLNHLGQRLAVDNAVGPETRWAQTMADQHPFRRQVVERALLHIGIAEEPLGSNRGALIDHWLKRCGVRIPIDPKEWAPENAWCAAFVSYCLSVPGYDEVKLARVIDLVAKYPAIPFEQTLPGDLGYLINPDGRTGHIWLLTGRDNVKRETMQVEGNTGNIVACTRRHGSYQYLRTMTLPTMPGIPGKLPLAGSQTR